MTILTLLIDVEWTKLTRCVFIDHTFVIDTLFTLATVCIISWSSAKWFLTICSSMAFGACTYDGSENFGASGSVQARITVATRVIGLTDAIDTLSARTASTIFDIIVRTFTFNAYLTTTIHSFAIAITTTSEAAMVVASSLVASAGITDAYIAINLRAAAAVTNTDGGVILRTLPAFTTNNGLEILLVAISFDTI
jgi:hypothetical protein